MQMKRLKNGMNVVFFESACTTFTTFAVNVKVGSDNEEKNFGISHFLEHMLFEGTKNRKAFDIVNDIESIGGYLNAGTDESRTYYHGHVPNGEEEKLVDVISDMIMNPSFDEKSVMKERSIISSEISNGLDDPFERSSMFAYEMIVGKPSVIGTRKDVGSMTKSKIVAYYNDWYVPNNMTAIVIGRKPIFDLIAEKFSSFSSAKLPARQKLTATIPRDDYHYSLPTGDVYATMAIPSVGFPHQDPIALDLTGSILDRPMSGRLNVATRMEKGLVYRIGCSNISRNDYGIFEIYFSTSKKNLQKCKDIVMKEVSKCDVIDDKEFESSKNNIAGKMMRDMENPRVLVDLASLWDSLGDITMVEKYVPMIRRVKIDDITRVKEKYLEGRWMESIVG